MVDTALCCTFVVRSYVLSAAKERCPVLSWLLFAGTWAWTISVVLVVWRPWLTLFPSIPASLDTFFNFSNGVFFPIGTLENHDVGFVGVLLQWLQIESSFLIANTGRKLVDIRVQEMNVTSQLCWSGIVTSAVHWYCHQNFGPEKFGPPDWNFQQKNGPPGPLSIPGNLVQVMQTKKTVSPWRIMLEHSSRAEASEHNYAGIVKSIITIIILEYLKKQHCYKATVSKRNIILQLQP